MNSPTPSIELREAKSPEELHAIYRFRYEIYVEEMQRKQHYADHDARLIKDPLDENGWNIAAWEGDTVVGVVRVNPIADPATESYARLYDVAAEDGVNHEEATLVSRLMTRKHLRGTRLAQRLAVASFEWITGAGYRTVYIDCNAHLVDWFRALGFKVARRVEHPEYGLVSVMRLDVYDEEHLDKLKSPFLAVLRQIQGNEAEWKTWVSNNLAQQ